MAKRSSRGWDAGGVKGLRAHLALTQAELAAELGVRQQTVSEWETGVYAPRGASERLLTIVAERAGFSWDAGPGYGGAGDDAGANDDGPARRPRRPTS